MRFTGLAIGASFLASTLISAEAGAQERSDPIQAAGWATIGVGTALGGGSVATGAVLLANDPRSSDERIGVATLAGGIVTIVVSLAIGIPLVSSRPEGNGKAGTKTTVAQALAGTFRF